MCFDSSSPDTDSNAAQQAVDSANANLGSQRADFSFAGGLDEGQDKVTFDTIRGGGNVNFTSGTSDDGFSNDSYRGPNRSVTSNLFNEGVKNVFGDQGADTFAPGSAYNKFRENFDNSLMTKIGGGIAKAMNYTPMGFISTKLGLREESRYDPLGDIFEYSANNPDKVTLGEDGLSLEIDTGEGTLTTNKFGVTTYTGNPNADYEGPFSNLVNPPKNDDGDDSGQQGRGQTPLDPCPAGFKFNSQTNSCEPVSSTGDQTIGDSFVRSTPSMPSDLSRYGRDGLGEFRFFEQMPGIINAKDGIPRGKHGEVIGAGGPKDDLVGPFMLSSQEYVEPYERVLDEGNGSYERGIKTLEKKRMKALRKYSDRVKSEERNRA